MASTVTENVSFYLGKIVSEQPNIILQGDLVMPPRQKGSCDSPRETGNPATFFTCFSFTIHALNVNKTADGLAFFLAPIEDHPKSGGGYLGIFDEDVRSPQNVVAVEFDTYINKDDYIADPDSLHIGLDVMSIKSKKTVRWEFENDLCSTGVDLTDALPEWVRVGFSAFAGHSETHDVNSWYFSSSFGDDAETLAEPLKTINPRLAAFLHLHFGSASN
ncbi:hypothetical protein PIB30_041168 [Stylosanthes scabra]|uniref:Legume lectin domain-containing protein n=1 Tax=Stylosanthes scabra TaxID=79078 RepID=A0ABU6VGP5_9FABA|nr:hypothetical protein [Stylosanthes scabra]